ncbi:MAG: DUF3298 and DUF4163 domain-containing protein [Bacteroidales bacterium]|nr:DUF3298 and DUF4163 domain-containing protein [Bacteroidales bacterium]
MKFNAGLLAILALVAFSCAPSSKELKTESFQYEDSTSYSYLKMYVELPVAKTEAEKSIREALLGVMDSQLAFICSYEGERRFPAFEGEADNAAVVAYYKENALSQLGKLSDEDAAERAKYFDGDFPGWGYEFSLRKLADTLGYVVFDNTDYVYSGGAHGGIIGRGSMTFDKKSGAQLLDFFKEGSTAAMQPILTKGLLSYFSEYDEGMDEENLKEHLMLWDSNEIPLPAWAPSPSADGLAFTYQQYEIASYADGMPNFTVAYEDLLPFLTDEAKALLIQ